ncbi:hypothetical protein HOP50_12g67530 [Chloropicon primus]|uniref:Uncharacterized protein n=3 Tax=Chloropicon primus TaxID=1764295 RepID=A0A5B8MVB0_9CHLO|nr:hypothetical protein A3770_12p67340 [Chloropicon primus]UPR03424.1 hypothetical protein HOP50_12g67530 [Chloropicon primus]|eukprot:QDZ24216.1 hypothetical protein A3770_12p67340 [Chloropicon primus]
MQRGALKERFYPKKVVAAPENRRLSPLSQPTVSRKPLEVLEKENEDGNLPVLRPGSSPLSRGKEDHAVGGQMPGDVSLGMKQLKQEIKRAREAGDKLAEGLSLIRLAEVKLENHGSQKGKPASSYAFHGAELLLNTGNIPEGLEGIRLYTQAKHVESVESTKRSKYFLSYQSCCSSEREQTQRDITVFDAFTKVVAKWGNALGEIAILEQIQKSYSRNKPTLKDFVFFDQLERITATDYRYIRFLREELCYATRFVTYSRDLDEDEPPRRKYLLKSLLWKAAVCLKLSRGVHWLVPKKAEEWNVECQSALEEVKSLETDSDKNYGVQRLCMESELLLLQGSGQDALEVASKALGMGKAGGSHLQVMWSSVAKARILVQLSQFEDALGVLKGALYFAESKLDENVKLDVYRCVECLQLKLGLKLKISALESQLTVQGNQMALSSGMKLERMTYLAQIVQKEKEIKNWDKVVEFATDLSEMAALENNSWEFLVEVSEAHYMLGSWPKVAVTSSEAMAMADAYNSCLGKCKALFFRALSRIAIGEYSLAESDLESCADPAAPESEGAARTVQRACLNLLSLIHGFVHEMEGKALEYQAAAEKMKPAKEEEKPPQPQKVKQAVKVDKFKDFRVLKKMEFGITCDEQNKKLLDLMYAHASAEGVAPSRVVERALAGLALDSSRALKVRAKGELGCEMSDADARILVNVIFSAEVCNLYEFDGIALEMPGNNLGNNTVKAICSKIQENPSRNVRLVGLDLSNNNLSSGSITALSRCEKIRSHLDTLLLSGNRRLLSSQGDIRALEAMFSIKPKMNFDAQGTMLSDEENKRLTKFRTQAALALWRQEGQREEREDTFVKRPAADSGFATRVSFRVAQSLAEDRAILRSMSVGNSETSRVLSRRSEHRKIRKRKRQRENWETKRKMFENWPEEPSPDVLEVNDGEEENPSRLEVSSGLSLSNSHSETDEEDFLRDDASSLSSHSDASQDRTRVNKRKTFEEEDWREALKKLRQNHLPHKAGSAGVGLDEGQSPSDSEEEEVGESVSCTSDSFSPKYKTQQR